MPIDRVPALLLALSVSLSAGCGAEVYQERIVNNTIPLFQYKQELDANLGPEWRKGEVRLRLPISFKEIPAPKKNQPERRLPPGFPEDLSGLLGGFQGTVPALSSEGTIDAPIHALVLSNRALLAEREPPVKPHDFDRMLVNVVSGAAGGGPLSVSALKPVNIGGKGFAPNLRFDAVTIEAAGSPVPQRYEIYVRRQATLQVAVVFIVPAEVDRSVPIRNQINLALQTLRIEQAGSAAGGSSPAPAASSPSPGGGPGF